MYIYIYIYVYIYMYLYVIIGHIYEKVEEIVSRILKESHMELIIDEDIRAPGMYGQIINIYIRTPMYKK
jgi:hypothetical protein